MIKKNTKVVFQDEAGSRTEDLVGGIPLSKGEIIHVHEGDVITDFEVAEKQIECWLGGEDQTVDITYTVKKL